MYKPLPPPIVSGTIISDRFTVEKKLGDGGIGDVYKAFDPYTQRTVALKVLRPDTRVAGDDEALRQEVILAQQVRDPNVCSVYDLQHSDWGPILVMEYIEGTTLHQHIRVRKRSGGLTAPEFRIIAIGACKGLAAIHDQGLVHGDIKPGNVMVSPSPEGDRTVILDFGFAQERARAASRKPDAPHDGGTPNYMSPERLRSGGASPEDDVYAMALTLWEMWTCVVPPRGCRPRDRPMRQQIMFDIPAMLSSDEIKPIFCGLNEDPHLRPPARRMRFFDPTSSTTGRIVRPREQLHPGAPPDRNQFTPDAQALLVTYASSASEMLGTLLPLRKQTVTLGRRADQDLYLAEETVSGAHAILRWKEGSWVVQDLGSKHGTFSDAASGRQAQLTLRHGGDVQVGECRLKLVSFQPDSSEHRRARRYLETHDGLTGLLAREPLMTALDEDGLLAEWAALPMQVVRFQLSAPGGARARPTIMEMLALRRVARRVIDQAELLLLSLVPLVAGRSAPLDFVASILGLNAADAQDLVDQVIALSTAGSLQLTARLLQHAPGQPARTLLDQL